MMGWARHSRVAECTGHAATGRGLPLPSIVSQAPISPAESGVDARAVAAAGRYRSADASVAIPQLLDTHGPRLYALALRLCGHRADAEDLIQEVFLQALRKWHTFRGDADPGTWLYTIAVRSCKARLRRKGGIDRRTPAVSQLMPWGESTVSRLAASDGQPGDERAPERQEAIEHVQRAIAALPEHLRLPLVLKEVLGVSVEDTARALGLAANTVKTRLHRARLALRKSMLRSARAVSAPAPIYDKQVCLDLLKTKMELMDRGSSAADFRVPQAEVCARCRAVFRELDLVHDACAEMATGMWPASTRAAIARALDARDAQSSASRSGPAKGRRPVPGKSSSRR